MICLVLLVGQIEAETHKHNEIDYGSHARQHHTWFSGILTTANVKLPI